MAATKSKSKFSCGTRMVRGGNEVQTCGLRKADAASARQCVTATVFGPGSVLTTVKQCFRTRAAATAWLSAYKAKRLPRYDAFAIVTAKRIRALKPAHAAWRKLHG
jgi:hypothetical protein